MFDYSQTEEANLRLRRKETREMETNLECGHAESLHSDITRGYGTDAKGNRHCYDCCHASDLSTMKETGRIDAYLSGNRITNWPGRSLLTVQREWETSAGGFLSGHRITRVYALATDGSRWHGRGPGQGMYIRMRRYKDGDCRCSTGA